MKFSLAYKIIGKGEQLQFLFDENEQYSYMCLVRGNVLGFSEMLKDSHIWLQIT